MLSSTFTFAKIALAIGSRLTNNGRTRAMESTTPTVTLARRRTVRSNGESANCKNVSQEEDALIFSLLLKLKAL